MGIQYSGDQDFNGRNGNGHSNGVSKVLLTYLPLILSAVALFQAVFVVGNKTGQIDEHLKNNDLQIADLKLHKAEQGEIAAQIDGLKEIQKITAANQDELRRLLEEQAGMYGNRQSARGRPGG